MGRAAFDDIGDVAFLPVQVDDGEHIVQELARRAYKGDTLQVLLLPRALAHKEQTAAAIAHTEDHIMAGPAQLTAVTVQAFFFQFFPGFHY